MVLKNYTPESAAMLGSPCECFGDFFVPLYYLDFYLFLLNFMVFWTSVSTYLVLILKFSLALSMLCALILSIQHSEVAGIN